MTTTMRAMSQLIRFDKPIGSLLLLWPTMWGLWIAAAGLPPLKLLFLFVSGVFVMRSAGCIINDMADRRFDGFVERTRSRPLVAGNLQILTAAGLCLVLLAIALLLVYFTNPLTVALAVIGLALTLVYPFCKRFFQVPQLVLGIAFSWGIPMAFSATIGYVPAHAWILFAAAVCWPIAYDTMYAMVDRNDDLQCGIYSSAIFFGRYDRLAIGILQVMLFLLLLGYAYYAHFSYVFYVGLMVAAGLAVYQQVLIAERKRENCFKAFLNNQWLGLAIWLGLVLQYV